MPNFPWSMFHKSITRSFLLSDASDKFKTGRPERNNRRSGGKTGCRTRPTASGV